MNTFSISEFKSHFLKLPKKEVVFFCGAGVSMSPPSFAPDWAGLRDLFVSSLFNPLIKAELITEEESNDLIARFNDFLNQNGIWLKPEVVLHWLYSRFDNKVFEVLEVLDYGRPNANHFGIAEICKRESKCKLVTTNFDTYFERAFANLETEYEIYGGIGQTSEVKSFKSYLKDNIDSVKILKPHGTTQDYSTIKATIQQVSKTPDNQFQNLFESFMKDRHIIIIGYSGNDYDIFPLLKKYSFLTKSISWFVYRKENMKKEITEFNCPLNLVFGDLNIFFDKFLHETHSENIVQKIREKFKNWSGKLTIEESGYVLCLIGMHTGFFQITKSVSSILLKLKVRALTKARLYNILGIINKRYNPKEAIKFYKNGIKSAYSHRYKNPITIANIYGNIGALYHEIGEQNKAIKYLSISNKWAKVGKSKFLFYSNLDDIANCLRLNGRALEAIKIHNKCIRYFKTKGNLIELSHSYNNKGLAYMKLKKYAFAERHILKALDIKLKETAELASIIRGYKNLGELRFLNKDYHDSTLYFIKAYRYALKFADLAIIPELLAFLSYNLKKLKHDKISKSFWSEFQSRKDHLEKWKANNEPKKILHQIIEKLQNEY